VNDCVEREMQDARSASHVISRGNNYDSPQTVLCNVTQLCARGKSVTRWMPPTQSAWPKKPGWPKGGLWDFSDSAQDTSWTLQSANTSNTSMFYVWLKPATALHRSYWRWSIALFITRQSSSRPRPLLAE